VGHPSGSFLKTCGVLSGRFSSQTAAYGLVPTITTGNLGQHTTQHAQDNENKDTGAGNSLDEIWEGKASPDFKSD